MIFDYLSREVSRQFYAEEMMKLAALPKETSFQYRFTP
jgi:hypothetical protein